MLSKYSSSSELKSPVELRLLELLRTDTSLRQELRRRSDDDDDDDDDDSEVVEICPCNAEPRLPAVLCSSDPRLRPADVPGSSTINADDEDGSSSNEVPAVNELCCQFFIRDLFAEEHF